jgi:hypothetical protein
LQECAFFRCENNLASIAERIKDAKNEKLREGEENDGNDNQPQ